ncbi:MAG: GtrA family protein [Pseudomonadota bacterium]
MRPARFLAIGALGFGFASIALQACLAIGMSPYVAQMPALALTILLTWRLNRRFTFHHAGRGTVSEFLFYLAASMAGLLTNGIVYTVAIMVDVSPAIALALGTLAAATVNWLGYSRIVYRTG